MQRGDDINPYDNAPAIRGVDIYDNNGFDGREIVRNTARKTNQTLHQDPQYSEKLPSAPVPPGNHPSKKYIENEDEPEYMESV